MIMQRFVIFSPLVLAVLFCASTANAEQKPSREAEQIRRLRQQLQQVQQEQQTQQQKIEQEKSELDTQLKRTGGELSSVRKKAAEVSKRATDAEAQVQALQQERDTLLAKLAESDKQLVSTKQLLSDTETKLKVRDGEANQLQAKLMTEQGEHSRCEANNLTLYKYGRELMDLYQHKGIWSALTQNEPITGIKRVQIENVLEEYRDKLDAQKLPTSAPATTNK